MSYADTAWKALIILLCGITLFYCLVPDKEFEESFLIDVPDVVHIDTIDPTILANFVVIKNKTYDTAQLNELAESSIATIGNSGVNEISGQNIKSVVESLYARRLDYTELKQSFGSFVVAISYDSTSNVILSYVIDQPWNLTTNIFTDPTYQIQSPSGILFVPKWKYSAQDPSPFFISDKCSKLIKQWETTSDPTIIRQLEANTCLSKDNKIRFVGMILVNYLNMLDQNSYNIGGACKQFKALASNIQNPELRAVFQKINEVCSNVKGLDDNSLQLCVSAYNDWLLNDTNDVVPNDSDCFSFANKTAFLDRLKKFMKIGQYIPTDYIDSFYLMVNQLYQNSKNKNVRSFLKNYQKTSANIDKWKQALDDLMTGVISQYTLSFDGKILQSTGIKSTGSGILVTTTKPIPAIECIFKPPVHVDSLIISGSAGAWISKLSLQYKNVYTKKWIEFPRILYANTDATTTVNVALDGIVSKHLRLIPLEFTNGIAFALDFLGYPVEISRCDEVISVCAHETHMASQQAALQSQQIQNQAILQSNSDLQKSVTRPVCRPVPRCLPCVKEHQGSKKWS